MRQASKGIRGGAEHRCGVKASGRRALRLAAALALFAWPLVAESWPYWRGGELVAVEVAEGSAPRRDLPLSADVLSPRIRTLLFPPPELGVDALLPVGGRLESLHLAPPDLVVHLSLPDDFLHGGGVTEELLEQLSRQLLLALEPWPEISRLHLAAADPRDPLRQSRTLPSFLPAPEREALRKAEDETGTSSAPLVRRLLPGRGRDTDSVGALDGKLLFVSQAHGFIDYDNAAAWSTQRGITHGIVEDFVNIEAINSWLLACLRGAGAQVFTLRERDANEAMVIVDDADGGLFPANGTYIESGDPGAFSSSGIRGFRNFQAPYTASENPFDNGGSARLIATAASATASAVWTPNLPSSGERDVYVSFNRDGSARASDAHYVVRHTGGESHFRVNQERHGWVWVHLGRFHFDAGHDPSRGSVALVNDSEETGDTVSADAVRFGGGFGDIFGEHHGTLSGRPRWEEGARTFTQYQGAGAAVWGSGDVAARSRFAAWEHFPGEDSIYLSWHSNAFNGSARGTVSYIYSSNPPDGTYDPNQSVPGSATLMNRVHDELINDIRAGWDPAWQDRGYKSAYFGEVNPAHNDEMPATLLEVAFHDNVDDATALAHPRFRQLLARAVCQGIVRYFAERDGTPARLLPEPPREVAVRATGATTALVSWLPPITDAGGLFGDPATGYVLYTSGDGRGFDDGTPVPATGFELTGLVPGETVWVRVSATNEGGESLPSEILAVRPPRTGDEPGLLLVAGFDRLDRAMLVSGFDPDLGGVVARMDLDRMNRFDGLVAHAAGLGGVAARLDSAANEAVASGRVVLDPLAHRALFWQLGEESTVDETFSAAEQLRVASYLGAGGALFVSGAETGWDLDHLGSAADRAFYRDQLRSRYVADDGGSYGADATPGGLFTGLAPLAIDDGTLGGYDVDYPDALDPEPGAGECLAYTGTLLGACVQTDLGSSRVVNLGFPVEAVYPPDRRADLLTRAAVWLGFESDPHLFSDGFEAGDTSRWSP